MTWDDNDRPRSKDSDRPDASFIRRLEDDSLWQEEPRPPRRADRYAERRADRYAGKRADRRPPSSRRRDDADHGRGPSTKRPPRRSRGVAVAVLVIVAVILLVAALEFTDAPSSSQTSPFSLLPIDIDGITATTEGEPSASSVPSTATTAATSTSSPSP